MPVLGFVGVLAPAGESVVLLVFLCVLALPILWGLAWFGADGGDRPREQEVLRRPVVVSRVVSSSWFTGELRCPVCRDSLEGYVRLCEVCATPHHPGCWDYSGGCTRYACTRKEETCRCFWLSSGRPYATESMDEPRRPVAPLILERSDWIALGVGGGFVLLGVAPVLFSLFW